MTRWSPWQRHVEDRKVSRVCGGFFFFLILHSRHNQHAQPCCVHAIRPRTLLTAGVMSVQFHQMVLDLRYGCRSSLRCLRQLFLCWHLCSDSFSAALVVSRASSVVLCPSNIDGVGLAESNRTLRPETPQCRKVLQEKRSVKVLKNVAETMWVRVPAVTM